jgi:hypothetical protein
MNKKRGKNQYDNMGIEDPEPHFTFSPKVKYTTLRQVSWLGPSINLPIRRVTDSGIQNEYGLLQLREQPPIFTGFPFNPGTGTREP